MIRSAGCKYWWKRPEATQFAKKKNTSSPYCMAFLTKTDVSFLALIPIQFQRFGQTSKRVIVNILVYFCNNHWCLRYPENAMPLKIVNLNVATYNSSTGKRDRPCNLQFIGLALHIQLIEYFSQYCCWTLDTKNTWLAGYFKGLSLQQQEGIPSFLLGPIDGSFKSLTGRQHLLWISTGSWSAGCSYFIASSTFVFVASFRSIFSTLKRNRWSNVLRDRHRLL